MAGEHRIIVSAENNPYMAWQAKLFHFSCLTRLAQPPVLVVHGAGGELHPDFQEVERAGGRVVRAPSYRMTAYGYAYPPRNTAGTLLHAAELCEDADDFIVLCDPDMIFVRRPQFPSALAGDFYSYMDYDREFVAPACRALGLAPESVGPQKEELRCGAPYVIPAAKARDFAETWLKAIDLFPPRNWENSMYAFGLTAVRLGLRVQLTSLMESNYRPHAGRSGDVIHYCYGDETWSKRHYFTEEQARRVWEPQVSAPRETVLGEILAQIREARDFYRRARRSIL